MTVLRTCPFSSGEAVPAAPHKVDLGTGDLLIRNVGFRDTSQIGTVNLIGSGRDKAHEGWSHERLCPSGHAGDRGPGLESLGPGGSILGGREVSRRRWNKL